MDVFHHHHRAVDENAEVDRADRQQVRGDVLEVEADERKQQRERNRRGDDQSRADVEQEEHEHDHHQHDPAEEIVFHDARRQRDQVHAVVERVNLHVLRQDVIVQFFGLRFGELEHGLRLLARAHQDHAFHRIVAIIESELPEARRVADHDRADVLHQHRNAVRRRGDDGVADVLGGAQPREAAHVIELSALGVEPAAGVVVVRAERRFHVGDREPRAGELGGVDQHLVLHRLAAEVRHVGDARHALERLREHPVVDDLQLHRRPVRTVEHVAVHET